MDLERTREHLRTKHAVYNLDDDLPEEHFMVFMELPDKPEMVSAFHDWLHDKFADEFGLAH